MIDVNKVLKGWECHMEGENLKCADCPYRKGWRTCNYADTLFADVYSVLKEIKKGKWIPVTNGRGGMECSVCHDYAPSFSNGLERLSMYCPNCGARMECR